MNDLSVNNLPLTSALDTQVDALLQRVTRDRDERCAQMRTTADTQAREILRSARTDARASMHAAVAQERSRLAQGLRQAEARAELEARRRAQQETQIVLQHMWAEIAAALETRWRDPTQRREWIDAAVRQADMIMPARSWRIEHGPGWTSAERSDLEAFAREHAERTIEWVPGTDVQAGLRVRCEGVCLDATPRGLLARRDDIEAAFLAEYRE